MWNTLLLNIVLCIAIIAVSHHIWEYLKTNYSTKKTKNLADIHASKYKTILNDIERSTQSPADSPTSMRNGANSNNTSQLYIQDVPEPMHSKYISVEEQAWMKAELDSFIQSL